jgi:hypothetical protein
MTVLTGFMIKSDANKRAATLRLSFGDWVSISRA